MRSRKPDADKKQRTPPDWNEARRRLETAGAALEQKWEPGEEQTKRILRERAKALARESPDRAVTEASIEAVEFLLAHERYAVESSYVREVLPLRELTPLPGTPPYVLGIINVHGRILSIIDIKKFFDLPEKGLSDLDKVIILQSNRSSPGPSTAPGINSSEGMAFGILADAISGVRRIPMGELQPSLPTLTGIREEYLKGVTGERVVLLDAEKLLSDEKIVVDEKAGT